MGNIMKKYLFAIKGYIVLSIVFYILETVVTSMMLLLPGYLIDNFYSAKTIGLLSVTYVALFIIYLIICYLSNRLSDKRRIAFEGKVKKDFFNSVMNKECIQFQEYEVGEYISMQGNDITELCQNYLGPTISVVRSLIMIVVFGVSLIYFVDFTISAVIMICSIIVVFIPNLTSKELAKRNHEYFNSVGQYTTKVTNLFQSFTILDQKSKQTITKEHDKEIETVLNKNMHFRKLNSLALVLNGGSVEFVNVIAFILVAYSLFNGNITVGMALTVFMYSSKFIDPIHELNLSIGKIRSISKIKEKLNIIMEEVAPVQKTELKQLDTIEISGFVKQFDEVTIQFEDMTFTAKEKYLLIGDNGVGKSVLFKSMMNFNHIDDGQITLNGFAGNEINVSDYIAYCPQNSFIFDANYQDNVTLFGTYSNKKLETYEQYFPSVIIEKIKNSKSLINCSGGEKQVICLLRSLCMNKPVLLLDEPFSAMNASTINTFMQNLNKIDSLVLIIAHNLENYYDYFSEVKYITSK